MNEQSGALPSNPKPELVALTSLRGIAAILVMLHHFLFVLLPDLGALLPSKLFIKSYLWVDLFFILSGFVLAYVYHEHFRSGIAPSNYKVFMQTRFARIYPLHFAVLMAFVALEGLQWLLAWQSFEGMQHFTKPFTGGENLETLLTNLLLLQTLHWDAYWNPPAWSISAEWIIYFTLPFLLRYFLPVADRKPLLFAIACLLPLVAIEWRFGDLGLYYAGWPMLIRCFCEATLGVIAFRCYQHGAFARIASGRFVMPALLLNLFLLALPIAGVWSVAAFTWLVLCAARSQRHRLLANDLVTYLGKISYSIYLVHWFVLDITRDSVVFFSGGEVVGNLLEPGEQWVLLLTLSIITIGLSHFTYHKIEAPARKILQPRARLILPPMAANRLGNNE